MGGQNDGVVDITLTQSSGSKRRSFLVNEGALGVTLFVYNRHPIISLNKHIVKVIKFNV